MCIYFSYDILINMGKIGGKYICTSIYVYMCSSESYLKFTESSCYISPKSFFKHIFSKKINKKNTVTLIIDLINYHYVISNVTCFSL